MNTKQKTSPRLIKLSVLIAICCVLAIAVLLLPKGFKADLSLIGKGNTSAVLLHDKNLVGSTKMMELLNRVRSDYEPDVVFLVADIATPAGSNFSRAQSIGAVSLLLFDTQGQRLAALNGGITEQQLRDALDKSTQ